MGELLDRLTTAISAHDPEVPLSGRLCDGYRALAGADAAALTMHYETSHRVTLWTTDELANQLEDLQDVLGEGPGHAASDSGSIETCIVPAPSATRWPIFVDAAQDVVERVQIHAVPIHPDHSPFGVITLYQAVQPERSLALDAADLQFLANVVGVALITDSAAPEAVAGPWASRARIHQATGMVVAQLRINPQDALAVLRAHAYGQRSTLADIADAVIERRIRFPSTDWWPTP